MRGRWLWFMLLLGGGLVFSGAAASNPAHAQAGCELPADLTAEQADLAQQFETELRDLYLEFNSDQTVDPNASLANLLGFAGKYDLPPGQLVVDGIVQDLSSLPCPVPDGGSKLSGECMGMAMSFDDKGQLIDIAADLRPDDAPLDMIETREQGVPVQAFTKSNPFQVHVDGFVAYVGKAGNFGAGPLDHRWKITTFGAELDSGGDPNTDLKNRNAGGVNLAADLPGPAKINGLWKIEGELKSENGITCDGSGYFETTGGLPIAQGLGVIAIVGAGLGALFNARPAKTWKG
jgi:hypothetical protein